ncbi:MAG: hypothetical protein HY716_10740 [Planctomycetes bacterium]|nr:hypothetical protein [Planctomycetota bacterium]
MAGDGRHEKQPPWARELSAEMRAMMRRMEERDRRNDEERREMRAYLRHVSEKAEKDREEMRAYFQEASEKAAEDRQDFKKDRANFARLTAMVVKTGNDIRRLLEEILRTLRVQGNGRHNR